MCCAYIYCRERTVNIEMLAILLRSAWRESLLLCFVMSWTGRIEIWQEELEKRFGDEQATQKLVMDL